MEGDWFQLASLLHRPVWQLKLEIPLSEFRKWQVWMRNESWQRREKWESYAAAIIFEIQRTFLGEKRIYKNVPDALLNFRKAEDKPKKQTLSPEKLAARHKQFFAMAWGMKELLPTKPKTEGNPE